MGHDYACHWAGKRDAVTDRRRRADREDEDDADSDDRAETDGREE